MGKSRKKQTGICKLTRTHGVFVDSHIIPKAFTKPEQPVQLSTLGSIHNQAPIAQVKEIPSLDIETASRYEPIFRFYFDGLIVHIHRHSSDDGYTNALGNMVVGQDENLIIATRTYEGSYQKMNMELVISESNFG